MEFPDAAAYLSAIVRAAETGGDLAPLRERIEHIRLSLVKRAGINVYQQRLADRAASAVLNYINSGGFYNPVELQKVSDVLRRLRLFWQ